MKKERRNFLRKDKRAISAVIGVILMVVITIMMAAIVLAWSSRVGAPETPKQCGVSVRVYNSTYLIATVTGIKPVGTTVSYINYTDSGHTDTPIFNNTAQRIKVGSQAYFAHTQDTNLVITCEWSDRSIDILYDNVI